jgi:hypothetical protein
MTGRLPIRYEFLAESTPLIRGLDGGPHRSVSAVVACTDRVSVERHKETLESLGSARLAALNGRRRRRIGLLVVARCCDATVDRSGKRLRIERAICKRLQIPATRRNGSGEN